MTTPSESLLLFSNDTVFTEMLEIVGHTKAEIDQMLPVFRRSFLMTFFFSLATFLPEEEVEDLLNRVKTGDFQAITELIESVPQDQLIGSHLFAFEDVYGNYAKEVMPILSEVQKNKLKEKAEEMLQRPKA